MSRALGAVVECHFAGETGDRAATSVALATFQLRVSAPTASQASLDNRHWSLEPGVLFNLKLLDFLTLEGQGSYRMPLTDYAYAGDVAKYGIGIVCGQRSDASFWFTPVVEAIGWTVTSGRTEIVHPTGVSVESAAGTTIFNGAAGLRVGFGGNMELYGGYSRALTGPAWYRDQIRVEFRLVY